MSWINDITESPAYNNWLHSQCEPEERLFVGRTPPKKELPGWMLRCADMENVFPIEKPVMDDEYLKKHGII